MTTVTLRSQKAQPLTNQEIDDNFSNLNTNKLESVVYSNCTTSGSGWFRVATTSSDGRGTYNVDIYTTGGNHNPSILTVHAQGDSSSAKLLCAIWDEQFPASSVRITRSATNTYLEVNFTISVNPFQIRVNHVGHNTNILGYSGALSAGGDTVCDSVQLIGRVNTSKIYASDARTSIVYDSDNTSYYLNPASTSVLNALTVGNSSVWTQATLTNLNQLTNGPGYLTGNQTISISGDVSGSGTTSIALTLANSGVTAGTYGSSTNIPQIIVNAKGLITSVSNVAVSIPSGSLTFTGDVTGTGTTGSSTTLTLANSGVTAGTYGSSTSIPVLAIDSKGRITSISTSAVTTVDNAYYGIIQDTRAAQYSPNDYTDYRTTWEFTNQITGLGDWHSLMTLQGWHNSYAAWQIIGPASTGAHENWYLRSGVNSSWNVARTILHSGNYSSYALPLSGGTLTDSLLVKNTGTSNKARLYTEADNAWFEQIKDDGTIVGRLGFDGYGSSSAYYTEFTIAMRGTGDSGLNNILTANVTRNLTLGGITNTASNDFRAPIFYDSNDTSYYVDPSNTGTSARFAGQIVVEDGIRARVSNFGSPYVLYALSDTYDSSTFFGIKYIEGNPDTIQIIGNNNLGLSIGMDIGDTTASSSLRAPIFYDSNDTGYYGDFNNGGVRAWRNSGYSGGISVADDGGYLTYRITTNNHSDSWQWQFTSNDITAGSGTKSFWVTYNGNHAYAAGSMRAPIFYDSDDTGYYIDPNSVSVLNKVAVGGNFVQTVYEDVKRYSSLYSSGTQAIRHTIGRIYFTPNHWGDWSVVNIKLQELTYSQGSIEYNIWGWYGMGNGSSLNIDVVATNGWARSDYRVTLGSVTGAGWQYASANVYYQDVFVDLDYYAGVEVMIGVEQSSITTSNPGSGTGWAYVFYDSPAQANISSFEETHQLRDRYSRRTNNLIIGSGTYGNTITPISDSNMNLSTPSGSVYFDAWPRMYGLYDLNDTSYYVDPHSTSYQRSLFLGAHDSGDSEFRFGEDSSGWYGDRWYWDSAYTVYRYSRFAGSDSLIHYHDTRDGSRITYGRNIVFDNYGKGIVGTYSSYRYQGVFSMGDSYKLPADGTTTGNLYGIAWSHPNAGGVAGNLASHGMLILENGGFQGAWGGGRLVTPSDIRGTIFYDYNDTGYYIDPNSTSDSALRIRGGALHGPNPTWGAYLLVGGDGRQNYTNNGTVASISTTNGNLHLDAASGYDTYINYYDGGNVYFGSGGNSIVAQITSDGSFRSPIFYDYNDTGYYIDSNGTSRTNYLVPNKIKCVGNVNNEPRWDFSAYVVEAQHWYGNNSSQTMYLGEGSNTIQIPGSGGIRPTIMYDYNDTTYYCDPNSTSFLYRIRSYYIRNPYDVSVDHPFGLYFADNESTAYAIYRESGAWTWPYPDLRIAFHTGIKIGANASYKGVRFYTDYDMSSLVMSVNNADYVSGGVYVHSDLRAPIMYDANDTAYYCDPASTNRLNFVNSNNHYIQPGYMLYSDHGGWTGEYNKIQWHSSHLYLQNGGGGYLLILRRGDGGERFYCDYSGNVTASGNITAYSDRSLKENILTIQNPLQLVSKLRGVTFDWIETKKPSYGLIAQEVEQVIPELVLEIDTGTTEIDSSKKIKTVDYGKMVSVLIEAIKEQQQQIDELKNLVKQLVQ